MTSGFSFLFAQPIVIVGACGAVRGFTSKGLIAATGGAGTGGLLRGTAERVRNRGQGSGGRKRA